MRIISAIFPTRVIITDTGRLVIIFHNSSTLTWVWAYRLALPMKSVLLTT
jgi:hypothetical protein